MLVWFLTIFATGIVFLGGHKMKRLESRRLAVAAAILALVPFGPAVLIGVPVGIWALVVLTEPDVEAAFGRRGSS
jgi:hypothetical protein